MNFSFYVPNLNEEEKESHVDRVLNADWEPNVMIAFERVDGNMWGLRILSDQFMDSLEAE